MRQRCSTFQDDFLFGAHTELELLELLQAFLALCREYNVTLNPAKCRVGYEEETFFGFIVNKKESRPSEKNLNPLTNLAPPANVTQLRSFLGIAVQCASYVQNFALICKPLHLLLKKATPFVWDKPQQDAFDTLRRKLLGGVSLRPPNFELPFCLLTDASDEGWGAALCQYDEAPCAHEGCEVVTSSMPVGKGARRFFCCDEHHKASALKFTRHDLEHKHRNVIAWFSKAYPESVRSAPVSYREAFAALTGLILKARLAVHAPGKFLRCNGP